MKKILILLFAVCQIGIISAQKKEIDLDAVKNCIRLGRYEISNDGKFIWYSQGTRAGDNTLIVCDNNGRKKFTFNNCNSASFTTDSRHLVCKSGDSILIINLLVMKLRAIPRATKFKVPAKGNGQYLFYKQDGHCKLENLYNNKLRTLLGINDIFFNDQGTTAILKGDSRLVWLDLLADREYIIFEDRKILDNLRFNVIGSRVVFGIKDSNGVTIYQYDPHLKNPEKLVDKYTKGIEGKLDVSIDDFNYSDDGEFIFFKLQQQPDSIVADGKVITSGVNIWNFRDKKLQSFQRSVTDIYRQYMACLPLDTKIVIQLENDNQLVAERPKRGLAILKNRTDDFETYWNGEEPQYKLVSLRTGEKKNITPSSTRWPESLRFSESGKYITWQDTDSKETFCYSIKTDVVTKLVIHQSDGTTNSTLKISGWLKDDVALICHDNFDVWQLDPENRKSPIPITSDYGKKNGIQFRPVELLKKYSLTTPDDSLLLTAMEVSTKYNGYKKVRLSRINDPGRSFLSPYLYYFPDFVFDSYVRNPIKSNASSVFLLQRQNDITPSNLFLTKDFINYNQVSDIKPLAGYRNYKAELISWKGKSGQDCFGILYKPEDLDTSKKYPIIFNYYETRSFERYQYRAPELGQNNINVSWYTSRGYAVFIPDVPPMRGKTGPIALETIESAAEYLTRIYNWIDKDKIGGQGHSHGGYLTNYIVTHSKLFAAAQSSSGYSDFISGYGQLGPGDISLQFMQEVGQNNLGTVPWRNPEVYMENSCIFSIDKVATPLLIVHNKEDVVVPFAQAVELFTALRRERKPVWLLEYDNEGHILTDSDHILDFCTRQQQFFDHYLKGMLAPEWMVEGVSAKYKGIISGLALDSQNRIP